MPAPRTSAGGAPGSSARDSASTPQSFRPWQRTSFGHLMATASTMSEAIHAAEEASASERSGKLATGSVGRRRTENIRERSG